MTVGQFNLTTQRVDENKIMAIMPPEVATDYCATHYQQPNWTALIERTEVINTHLHKLLDARLGTLLDSRFLAAIEYAVSGSGKRFRPIYFLSLVEAGAGVQQRHDQQLLLQVACALECLHCYSLVHDDLPAMDDSDTRRGRASCHVKFDQATALLTGNSLYALAFELLADLPHPQANIFVSKMAQYSGAKWLCAGQYADLIGLRESGATSEFAQADYLTCYRQKTSSLFYLCLELAMLCCEEIDESTKKSLTSFNENLGLIFQLANDWQDQKADAEAGEPNYINMFGVERGRQQLNQLYEQADIALGKDKSCQFLRELLHVALAPAMQ